AQKAKSSLIIALGDIFAACHVLESTKMLSDLADAFITSAFRNAAYYWAKKGKLPIAADKWGEGTGLIVTAMGKLGAYELNYSSDIDICVFFDPDGVPNVDKDMLYDGYIRTTQTAIKLLSERTENGYVYRTDLRLRPDPSSTKVAVPIRFAERYYERSGQNWERAAWIKGRFVAGDPVSWVKFQTILRPFIWRKHLDYAAIQDIQSIKRQLHAHYKQDDFKAKGHDIKVGRGGIREIELYIQTQQLIGGGRDSRLRSSSTFAALDALTEKEWVTQEDARELKEAYLFYRKIEHRLQMVRDEQTHLIPTDEDDFANIASFCDYKTPDLFEKNILLRLKKVSYISDKLFAVEKPLGSSTGSLVFTGHDDHPQTVTSLTKMGFKAPEKVIAIIRNWHFGKYRAMRSSRSREILTEITPSLLNEVASTADPDSTMARLDDFIAKLPYGVRFLSYLLNSPNLFKLVIDIMGNAPDLADYLAKYPETFDVMAEQDFYTPSTTLSDFQRDFSYRLRKTMSLEGVLNLLRRFNREQRLRIGVAALRQSITIHEAGHSLAYLAAFCIEIAVQHTEKELRMRYNLPSKADDNSLAIVAMGSLGGTEMHAGSDLDLLMIYRGAWDIADNRNDLPDPQSYYSKFGQRILSALSARTEDGILYDVDMRLRPSGNSGPLVVNLARFEDYHKHHAQTWEHLALLRAAPLTGPPNLCKDIEKIIHDVLCLKRDPVVIASDIHSMREKLLQHRKAATLWDVKLSHGGMFDVSFIIHYLALIYAHDHPEILNPTLRILMVNLFEHKLLSEAHYSKLLKAWDMFLGLMHFFALTKVDVQKLMTYPEQLLSKVGHITGGTDYKDMEEHLQSAYQDVQKIYNEIIAIRL
ncbi:MAG: bifunctional [glutamine synthetase] adenylyltransferase/[glutamine synthetase]-adenylyl-L-tyrosine phosphorylase, partial [Pseudomonadota bacterium]